VVQPLERVDGEWVVYGMGNFLAHQGTFLPANQEGLVVRFTFHLALTINADHVRLLDQAARLAQAGFVTGASHRNWAS
jgi:hypothetical protein